MVDSFDADIQQDLEDIDIDTCSIKTAFSDFPGFFASRFRFAPVNQPQHFPQHQEADQQVSPAQNEEQALVSTIHSAVKTTPHPAFPPGTFFAQDASTTDPTTAANDDHSPPSD